MQENRKGQAQAKQSPDQALAEQLQAQAQEQTQALEQTQAGANAEAEASEAASALTLLGCRVHCIGIALLGFLHMPRW